MRSANYEVDNKTFSADAYKVSGYPGVAWYVLGWETQPTEDTEWDGIEARTGDVVCVMVGDDRPFVFPISHLTWLERKAYCGECGQIGCEHGRED